MNYAKLHLYGQLLGFLRQYSRARDLRHLKALACGWSRINFVVDN